MNPRFVAASLVLVTAVALRAPAQSAPAAIAPARGAPALSRSTPEAQGISSRAILSFVQAADSSIDGMNSFMLMRHGKVVAEGWWSPYEARTPHVLYSLSKSFTSTAAAFAVAEGLLNLDATVLSYFPERCRSIRSNLCAGSCSARLIGSRAACSPTTSRVRTPSPRSSSG
jgi:CubicO group peptidase (beta-lactamase class C family)